MHRARLFATIISLALGGSAGLLTVLAPAGARAADGITLTGVVTHDKTGVKLRDVIVAVQCNCIPETLEGNTNEQGMFVFRDLPPGVYTVQVFAGKSEVRKVVTIGRGKNRMIPFKIDPEVNNVIVVEVPETPVPQSAGDITKIGKAELEKVPLNTKRDLEGAVTLAPGTTTGANNKPRIMNYGENETKWTVDSANVGDPSFGFLGSSIVQDFLQGVEVLESGYDAEFGGASGGQVNARRISGGNELRGSARFTFTPRLARPRFVLQTDEALRVTQVPDYAMQGVVTASGPIVQDKLFWSAGLQFGGTEFSLVQQFYHRVDKDGSGGFEGCPYNNGDNDCVDGGNYIASEKFAQQEFGSRALSGGFVGGLDWAINPKHRLTLTALGGPAFSRRSYRSPLAPTPNAFGGNPSADPLGGGTRSASGVIDDHFGWDMGSSTTVSLGYLGRVARDKLEIDAGVAYSRFASREAWKLDNPEHYELPASQQTSNRGENLFELLDEAKSTSLAPGVQHECNAADIPGESCPVRRWLSGGVGQFGRDTSQRVEGRLALTHFFTTGRAGSHQLKYGAQIEHVQRDTFSRFSGTNRSEFYSDCPAGQKDLGEACWNGSGYDLDLTNRVNNRRFVVINSNNPDQRTTTGFGRIRREQNELRAIATPLGAGMRSDGYRARLATQNYGVFLQDKWAVRPNLFLNAGVRWEAQDMHDALGNRALLIADNIAPRVGMVYDWTGEGRSRLYASYGRFYQPLPLQLTSRVFGGLVQVNRSYRSSDCEGRTKDINGTPEPLSDRGQPTEFCTDFPVLTTGLSEGAVVPRLKGMYRDQFQLGYQQEIIEDLLLRISWAHSSIGRAVEDVSTDGGNNFIVANPGEKVAQKDIRKQESRCAALSEELAGLPADADNGPEVARALQRCEFLASSFTRINELFDRPTQNSDAFTFELQKRFAKNWTVRASYTYSRLVGNYQGMVDPISGAVTVGVDPQYDIPELVRNSFGPLPFDQRHRVRVNGFYTFDLKEAGRLTVGTSFNLQSGYPVSVRADNNRYAGAFLTHVLPRGSAGRVEPNYQWNLSLGYNYALPKDLEIEVAARVLNVTNAKAVLRVDEVYSFDSTRPVAGGTLSDLKHTKIQSQGNPTEFFQRTIVSPQGNFGVESQFQNPLAAQFDLSLRF